MIRRTVLPFACIAALSGCATFTQDDVVASYDDNRLERDEFDARYERLAGAPVDGRLQGDAARSVITNWIFEQVLDEAGVVDRYEEGPEASGILCVSLVRPVDLGEAEGYLERLEGGEAWTDLLASDFPDVPANGDVSCVPTVSLGPLAPQVAGMTLDNPYAVFLFDDLSVAVLRMRATAEVDPLEIAGIVQTIDPESIEGIGEQFESAEIAVDPRFGQFDIDAGGVIPLG